MSKEVTLDIFRTISDKIANMPAAEAYENLGGAVGLVALAIEREHGIDRNDTFKMIQRWGHNTIKVIENNDIKGK